MCEFLNLMKMELPFRRWRWFYLALLGLLAIFTHWTYCQMHYRNNMTTTVVLAIYFVGFFRNGKPQTPGNVFHRILPVKPWKSFLAYYLSGFLIFFGIDFLSALLLSFRYEFIWPTWQPTLLLLYANVVFISLMIMFEVRNNGAIFSYPVLFLLLYIPPIAVGTQQYWESTRIFAWPGLGVAGIVVSFNCYLLWKRAIFGKKIPFRLILSNVILITVAWGLAAWLFWKGAPPPQNRQEIAVKQETVIMENENVR